MTPNIWADERGPFGLRYQASHASDETLPIIFPALLPVAAVAAILLFGRSAAGLEQRERLMKLTIAAAIIAVLGVIPLFGIPGAAVYEVSAPWVHLLLGEHYADLGASAWPVGIIMTLAWPWSLVVAYAVANGALARRTAPLRWLAFFLVAYGAGIGLALWAHLFGPPLFD
jgi:hypothetical protein